MRPLRLLAPLLAAGLVLAACSDGTPVAELTAEPVPVPTSDPTPSETPSDEPSPSPTETSPSASETPSRAPTDTDRARFVSGYTPEDARDLEHVATDLDGDGEEEIVFAYVRAGDDVAHIDVAWWDGAAYAVVFADDGGPAARVDRLRISDINADGLVEIVTEQSATRSAASLTLWQVTGREQIRDLVAVGGCNAGRSTYGVVGAELEDRNGDGADEVYATCDDSPLPVSTWSTDRYVWTEGEYRHDPETIE